MHLALLLALFVLCHKHRRLLHGPFCAEALEDSCRRGAWVFHAWHSVSCLFAEGCVLPCITFCSQPPIMQPSTCTPCKI